MQWGRFLVPPMASTKLQQSLAAFERAFVEEAEADRLRREQAHRERGELGFLPGDAGMSNDPNQGS